MPMRPDAVAFPPVRLPMMLVQETWQQFAERLRAGATFLTESGCAGTIGKPTPSFGVRTAGAGEGIPAVYQAGGRQ